MKRAQLSRPQPPTSRKHRVPPTAFALLLASALFALPAQAQWVWAANSTGTHTEASRAVAADVSGDLYVTGRFWGPANFGGTPLTNPDNYSDGFLAKYRADGTGLWARGMSATAEVDARALVVEPEGGVYVAGRFWGTATFGDVTLTAPPISVGDIFITKYSPDGAVLWARQVGGTVGPYAHHANGIAVGPDGGVYVVGSFRGTATFGPFPLTSAGGVDFFLAKLSPEGSFLWARRGGGPSDDGGNGIAFDAAGGIIVTGNFRGTATFEDLTVVSTGGADALVARYEPDGTLDWIRQGTGAWDGTGGDVGIDAEGNVYVAGVFARSITFGSHTLTTPAPNSQEDGFLVKYGPEGAVLWARRVGGPWSDGIQSMVVDPLGRSYVAGTFIETAAFGDSTITGYGGPEFFLGAFSPEGDVEWVEPANGAQPSYGYGVALHPAGGVAFTGGYVGTLTFGATTLQNTSDPGHQDMVLARYQVGSTTAEGGGGAEGRAFALSAAYPNPSGASTSFTVTLISPQHVGVTVYDALGRRVAVLHDGRLEGGAHVLSFDVSTLPPGVYLVRAVSAGMPVTRRLAVVR